METSGKSVRLQKALADIKLGSRRYCENLIRQGNVKINNNIAKLGNCVTSKDRVKVFNHLVQLNFRNNKTYILLYHKPEGQLVSTKDDKYELGISTNPRDIVFNYLPKINSVRWINVGRLDINTSGLLIFSNNGHLVQYLMHPKFTKVREYAVRVYGKIRDKNLDKLLHGIEIGGKIAAFTTLEQLQITGNNSKNQWFKVTLTEGRNRIVRKLWQEIGLQVSRLIRISYGGIILPRYLKQGKYHLLSQDEVKNLTRDIGFSNN